MNVGAYLTDDVNVVEVYFCPNTLKDTDTHSILCGWTTLPEIPYNRFKTITETNFKEYYYRDLVYTFDISNDSQKVIQRVCMKTEVNGNVLTCAMIEQTVPTHKFPCTNTLNHIQEIKRTQYKYTNRIFLHIEQDESGMYVVSLRYYHAYNVDLDKVREEFNLIYKQLATCIYRK